MCGLVGILNLAGGTTADQVLARMVSIIAHRGPDDSGTYHKGPVALGFRRLSILDLTPTGHQPMSVEDGKLTIVFNGEIYNFVELRRELEGFGHRFHSSGDTEVLARAYLQWGTACLTRLNGMWSFLIHDRSNGTVFGSRDRFGIKPLFIARTERALLFASEIKSILASGLVSPEIDWATAATFLAEGAIDEDENTFYKGIQQIRPAHAFVATPGGGYRAWRYWNVEETDTEVHDTPAEAYAALFEDAVRVHMRSDVPVAVHLSGGLDSTSILCAAARVRADAGALDPITAFSYMPREFDEGRYIRETVAKTGAVLVELNMEEGDLLSDIRDMLWYQDEPVHSLTALVGFRLMRLTAQYGVKVVLNGQGADETLAGYPSYFGVHWSDLLADGRVATATGEILRYAAIHKMPLIRLFNASLSRWAFGRLKASSTYRQFALRAKSGRAVLHPWLQQDFLATRRPRPSKSDGSLPEVLKWSVEHGPLPLFLRVEDRNAMAHSVEARVPFLDHRLVSFAWHLPSAWKLKGPWNKFILREAMRERIPEAVRLRPDKMGFPVPDARWVAGSLYDLLNDMLTSRTVEDRGIYRARDALRRLEQVKRGEEADIGPLFDIAQIEMLTSNLKEFTSPDDRLRGPTPSHTARHANPVNNLPE
jgi:asparagine synthase (glutamine-hydrolysing)